MSLLDCFRKKKKQHVKRGPGRYSRNNRFRSGGGGRKAKRKKGNGKGRP